MGMGLVLGIKPFSQSLVEITGRVSIVKSLIIHMQPDNFKYKESVDNAGQNIM